MELKPASLSPDGYIIRQKDTAHIPFGKFPSSKNGCGWIAVYNFLKADGRPADWEKIRRDLEPLLLFGGRIGANVWVIRSYLRRRGVRLRSAVVLPQAKAITSDCRCGMILFFTGRSTHYAAFQRQRNGLLRFFNSSSALPDGEMTLEEFCKQLVKLPVFFLFTTK